MPDSYFYQTLGMDFGPVSLDEIQVLLSQGVLGPGDQFRSGRGPWRDVSEMIQQAPLAKPGLVEAARVEAVSPSQISSEESAPWVILANTGVVGPLTTGQLLEAVQNGLVQPKTMVRLIQSSEWIMAEQITGLVFPQSGHQAASPPLSPLVTEVPISLTAPNAEMRHLFAECVSRQRSSQPAPPAVPSRALSRGAGSHLTWGITAAFSYMTGVLSLVLEWMIAFLSFLVRSRIAWAASAVLLVALMFPRISASLVSQEQVFSTLENTYTELKDLRAQDVDEQTWYEFQMRSSQTLAKLVPQLEKHADVNDKNSMSLLWIARDYLPASLIDPKTPSVDTEDKVEAHLAVVHGAIQQAVRTQATWDIWTTSIVGLDIFGALAAMFYFGKKRWIKN